MPIPWSQDRYLDALHFAARAHGDQTYPGTEISYILHLSFVAMEVIAALAAEDGTDGDLAVACALLHDTVEDTPTTAAEIESRFGSAIAAGVQALTKDPSLPKPERMPDSLHRIRQHPHAVWKVKLADRICNLQPPPPHWSREKCLRYRDEAQTLLDALGEASPFLAARLDAKITTYPSLI